MPQKVGPLIEFSNQSDKPLVALVVGAGGGIGSAVARGFRDNGVEVAHADQEGADREERPQSKETADLAWFNIDACNEASVGRLVEAVVERFGRLDFLVNAAGITGHGRLDETSLGDWQRVMDTNLTSCFLLCRAAYPHLKASRGAVALIGSSNGVNGGSHLSGPAYAVAKAGIHNLTRYLAKEWAADGIRINAVAPGPIDTPMLDRLTEAQHTRLREIVPLGRYGRAEEVAANILFLCSSGSAWQTGTIVNISGGMVL
ncbi:MAG: SDR family oxidoreductase [Rhodospirillaceae bacterium]|jgi:NAD(P)-dependent dehydrogenase (short-subunit alcohol dehydrogenase family)|nr:SDR family oxidoreductase [Rhodospirillaceae bacterium]MBT6137565.1 SDR family oxidoreductase [Rhodospirillaceae bacterium]